MLIEILIPVLIFIGLGLVTGILLSVFSKVFAVETDEKVEEVLGVLPGLNCGVCGYKGCEDYAKEMVHSDASTNKCIPGGDKTSQNISQILGKNFEDVVEEIAYVRCNGNVPQATSDKFAYQGAQTCAACNLYYDGKGTCDYGCMGFGDCVKKCEYDAISIVDEVAVIDESKCIGCQMCVASCPKNLIHIREQVKKVYVNCSSCDKGKDTMQKCANGCIGCKKCEKICPTNAIIVTDNLATIDYDKCINCLECVNVCPTKCIHVI